MLDRRPTAEPDSMTVTFRLPAEVSADRVHVVGDFNDWSTDAMPLEDSGDGFSVTLTLPRGRTYEFRYLLDGERWENDWEADRYVPNEFGGENSQLDLTGDVIFEDPAPAAANSGPEEHPVSAGDGPPTGSNGTSADANPGPATKADLLEQAKALQIAGRSRMTKEQLIQAVARATASG